MHVIYGAYMLITLLSGHGANQVTIPYASMGECRIQQQGMGVKKVLSPETTRLVECINGNPGDE